MKEKIILTIAYLFNKRLYIYLFILIFSIYMISSIYSKYLLQETLLIKNLDENKQKTLQIKEKELKPLKDKANKLTQEINALKLEIIPLEWCISKIKSSLWTKEDVSCEFNSFIPKVKADEKIEESKLLTPNELFYTTKVSDNCHISQNEQSHFTKAGWYMLATDVACDFNKDWKWDQFEVYAPDYLNKSYWYYIKSFKNELLWDYIELYFDTHYADSIYIWWHNAKWIIWHTTTNLEDWDTVETWERIWQSNITWYTTGYHNHIELWIIIDWKWKNISYTTRSEVLNNKRNNILSKWKEWDKFYFTHYDIGDKSQNNWDPNTWASGVDLSNMNILNPIALTIDVRKSLWINWGDIITLISKDGKEYKVTVHDEMNQRFRYSCIKKDWYCIKGDIAYRNWNWIPSWIYIIKK